MDLIHWNATPRGHPRSCRVERCDYRVEKGWFETAAEEVLGLGCY